MTRTSQAMPPNSNNSLLTLALECLLLSKLVRLPKLAVLIRMHSMVATTTTFGCGMLPWLLNREVSRPKVSSDKVSKTDSSS